ncbi:archaemetzincin [Flavobacterium silvaticum]|uniref:Zn-dependent protease n=1 Tax=Flavobacterium silvaticum TaxID=1852020 RepID=A0A972FTW2_9FLAO|nr:archaemetzincin [Flavobacterium silvaticum]NMH28403.1 Zn-dependent protease [Flavobacterium silvaticum]
MRKWCLFMVLAFLSCKTDGKRDYFSRLSGNDQPLPKTLPGEWLWDHPENGQTFGQFLKSKPIIPTDYKRTIYVSQIGKFNELQTRQIQLLQEYLQIFFQLEVKIGERISSDEIPADCRRIGKEDQEQLLASFVLDSVLVRQKTKDAIAFMGISELDLYPQPSWNYVFGLASYQKQVGVTSIFRLQDELLKKENFDLCLTRLLKVSSHEIGHMFGLHHCIDASCVMNGSNHLPETDKNPTRLCSHCQQKLQYSIGYDNQKRVNELIAFFKQNKLEHESIILNKDLKIKK